MTFHYKQKFVDYIMDIVKYNCESVKEITFSTTPYDI